MPAKNLRTSNRYIEGITGSFIFIVTISNTFLKNSIFADNSLYEIFYIVITMLGLVIAIGGRMIFASTAKEKWYREKGKY